MKLRKENVRIILENILNDTECWVCEEREAGKQLAYIAGLRDMANAAMEAIDELG